MGGELTREVSGEALHRQGNTITCTLSFTRAHTSQPDLLFCFFFAHMLPDAAAAAAVTLPPLPPDHTDSVLFLTIDSSADIPLHFQTVLSFNTPDLYSSTRRSSFSVLAFLSSLFLSERECCEHYKCILLLLYLC